MHKYERTANVAIVGARGYTGQELARLLLAHPAARLTACFSTDATYRLSDLLPEASAASVPVYSLKDAIPSGGLDAIFLATPAEVSMELAPKLLEAGMSVIDLSGAFRLEAAQYPKWYGFEHKSASALAAARYGLVPWTKPSETKTPVLISNPGCYATAALTAILPLLAHGLIEPETLVIDAKSGTSGAGKKAAENLLFSEVDGDCLPYKVAAHQHLPEIIRHAKAFAGAEIDPAFSTHLLPVKRGITAAVYARVKKGVTASKVAGAFAEAYENYALVRHGAPAPALLSLRKVVGSARAHVAHHLDGDKLYVYSAIDNLLKGAASQAVENLNALLGLPVTTGLLDKEGTL
jgi:N-acetyl-gamma-glutamyl-phosphate reductase